MASNLFDLKNLIVKNHDKYLQKKAALITNVQMGFGYRQFGKKKMMYLKKSGDVLALNLEKFAM